ncbi:MAG: hypothetical protein Q8L79_10925 [Methylobacter sp.]|nr:hypothetical protein [Methylobacter sp.]MDP1665624.1 hypothetical protein [Methylobacter sp.]
MAEPTAVCYVLPEKVVFNRRYFRQSVPVSGCLCLTDDFAI